MTQNTKERLTLFEQMHYSSPPMIFIDQLSLPSYVINVSYQTIQLLSLSEPTVCAAISIYAVLTGYHEMRMSKTNPLGSLAD